MGMNLLETLDEEVYYDGICTLLEDDGKGELVVALGVGLSKWLAF